KHVNHISLQEFKNLDCGSVKNPKFPEQKTIPKTHPPDLEEVFSFITSYERKNPEAKKVYLNIEIKANPHDMTDKDLYFHADKIITLAEKYSLKDRITIQSFEHIVLTYIKEKYPSVKTSALFSMTYFQFFRSKLGWIKGLQKEVIEKSITLKVDYISPFYAYVNPDFVKACHEKGLKLIPWTINSEEHIEEIMSYGVDGIISDYPDRLYRVWKKLSESSL
ncbi:MAG: glycerophosphodiester phosphodiesterase, partial [Leptospiraceae bacterium]|nr:glycerophosphodiester phosphodiesterase [Leptospiraceae bacterium]